jgi:hypothetical protein
MYAKIKNFEDHVVKATGRLRNAGTGTGTQNTGSALRLQFYSQDAETDRKGRDSS